jgi:hypothetical protein
VVDGHQKQRDHLYELLPVLRRVALTSSRSHGGGEGTLYLTASLSPDEAGATNLAMNLSGVKLCEGAPCREKRAAGA